ADSLALMIITAGAGTAVCVLCNMSALASIFFQAEDGIRALYVTGVQTCALPIYAAQMVVHGHQSLAVVDDDGEPVEEIIADLDHGARRRRGDGRSFGSGDIQAAVGLPRLVVEEAPQSEPTRDAPLRGQVESEAVERGIAESRKRPHEGFLLSRDPPQVFGLGIDLAAVGKRQVLCFVVAPADLEADRAPGSLAVEHG